MYAVVKIKPSRMSFEVNLSTWSLSWTSMTGVDS